jgi:histidinol-phosphate aminotransferase
LAAALAALRDEAHVTGVIRQVIAERERLAAALAQLGAECLPSFANFVTIRLPGSAALAVAALREAGIAVQLLAWPDAQGAIRISIGGPEESDRLLEVLRHLPAPA